MNAIYRDLCVIKSLSNFKQWASHIARFDPLLCVSLNHADDYGMSKEELSEFKKKWYEDHSPKTYPCIGYISVENFDDAEIVPAYFYMEDIQEFLTAMSGRKK